MENSSRLLLYIQVETCVVKSGLEIKFKSYTQLLKIEDCIQSKTRKEISNSLQESQYLIVKDGIIDYCFKAEKYNKEYKLWGIS